MKALLAVVLTLGLLLGAAGPTRAEGSEEAGARGEGVRLLGDGPHYLDLAVGAFEVFDNNDDHALAGQIEWRFGKKLYVIGPLLGVMANVDGGYIGYAGLYLDLALGRFVLSPQWGVGAYEEGGSKDLGGTFEFVSGLALSYEFENRTRLGVRYAHISNADLHDTNPGADLLFLSIGIAF